MWPELFAALALVLILEGLLPFISPRRWRETMQQALQLPDNTLRLFGLVALILGALLLWWVKS
ncbi:hypothetical protein SAMN05216526_1622 [Ectothiorhodosinus mongolicus]|uniref:DUF2065 domain-containing protein n=1 Tax=Ectothiorhodosinus mongolicus TaxID=233100 RepID=A0A1R3W450_9GAMM|nr:DUF2065 domain-containing protein [Ectothiorhodosinus mongolicus]ULX57463.1 DUF2065 domain-containing protein [Ectothiorhodosinus mongolicus]SIT72324.1 hypothetical protein SAMN05216526_1622 [Ectothiorhodosinus mongolicus]